MVPLAFLFIFFFFLVCGVVVFLLCLQRPAARRRALSAALWCAICGPCTIALLMFAGLSFMVVAFAEKAGEPLPTHMPRLFATLGWGYLTVGTLLTIGVATAGAWLHQAVIDRLPFSIFRIYATSVIAGIGSAFGWCVGIWRLVYGFDGTISLALWLLAMIALIFGFGFAAFRAASGLRTPRPLFPIGTSEA